VKAYFALSRTSHGILDIAAPAFCALLWLGGFPPIPKIVLALATAFAAYTAIYALNDLVGMRFDKEKFAGSGINDGYSVEASAQRYPLAQSLLSMRSGLLWMLAWFALALVGCWLLNPATALILVAAALLEIAYCVLFKVTYLRTIVSGMVKTCGPMAAIFAVDPNPSPRLLLVVFAWLFFWEIGGQNIPADWNDTAEDRRVQAKTVVLTFGFEKAGLLVMIALVLSVLVSGLLPLVSPARLGLLYVIVSVLLGYFMLLRPGFRLYRAASEGRLAARLFDRASYYPLAQFALIASFLLAQQLAGG
jgi:4-hydroxybenzoate polyprenyltransferase